ncbi:MAG: hypothetical protein KBT12_03185 [Bacteroidales bacterium]|nr:hypothetical protein [Candidatus Physcousia equi]
MKTLKHTLRGILLLSAWLLATACSDKEDTTPSNADTNRLEALLDRSIPAVADFCDTYGTYLLYNFDLRLDFAYQFGQATAWEKASIERLSRSEAEAAVAWLQEQVFSHYSDSFKAKFLPRKFLLAKSITSNDMLGRSEPHNGKHAVVANLNSITVGQYVDPQAIDRAILSDYLVNARGVTPVDKAFFEISANAYSTLMDENRLQARHLLEKDPEFFHENGFFNPTNEESTYFSSSRLDLAQYVDSLIGMTQEMHDRIMEGENTDMMKKMARVAHGLNAIGVDVSKLNPWALDFLEVNISGINPDVKFTSIPAAFTEEETVAFTLLRGENKLQKAEVYLGDQLVQSFDLTEEGSAPAIPLTVLLKPLKPHGNDFSVWVYEQGKVRPSAKVHATINYYTSDNVVCLTFVDDNPDIYTCESYRMTIDYNDGIVDNRSEKNIITVTFLHKPKFNTQTFEEYDGEKRFWRIHFDAERVDWIEEYEELVDYVSFSSSNVLRHTYLFDYDEEGVFCQLTKKDGASKQTIVSDVTSANGILLNYKFTDETGTRTYSPRYSPLDGTTRVDLLEKNLSGAYFTHQGTEEPNPFHIAGLPAVVPGEVAGVPLHFLYGKYLFHTLSSANGTTLWNTGWAIDRSDPNNPFNGTTCSRNNHLWSYRIILKN